ncbi:helix-turn-helix transcriptional regulator [Weeksellaceae bacterium A-14]
MAFGKYIKELRESKGLFLREVGAALELDNAFISKVENEERLLPRKHLNKLADFFNVPLDKLLVLWLSDKIRTIIEDEEIGKYALKIVLKELNTAKDIAG